MGHRKDILFYAVTATAWSWAVDLTTMAEESKDSPRAELPGYYAFFMKAGKLSHLKNEITRDKKIERGELKPIYGNEPVIDLRLPDGFKNHYGTRDYIGSKNLVLIAGRAWW